MPQEQPSLQETRKEAVKAAESEVEEQNRGPLQEVVDSEAELRVFFHKAHDQIKSYARAAHDPRLEAKLADIDQKYRNAVPGLSDYYFHAEKDADAYWQNLVLILESDEREKIQHGPDLPAKIGLPDSVRILRFHKADKDGRHLYEVEKDHSHFRLAFKPDHRIELTFDIGDDDRWTTFYKSAPRRPGGPGMIPVYKISKTVSLADLRDGSAFDVHLATIDTYDLDDALRLIGETFSDLPKRSSKPELAGPIALRDETAALKDEIGGKIDAGPLSHREKEFYMKTIASIFQKKLRQFYAMSKKSPLEGPELSRILEKYPHLLSAALAEVKSREELDGFDIFPSDVFASERSPYSVAQIERRRDELQGKGEMEKTLERIPAFAKLSPEHRNAYLILKSHGVNMPETQEFFSALHALQQKVLEDYRRFITDQPQVFTWEGSIPLFTREAAGLNSLQFAYYCEYAQITQFEFDTLLKGVNKIFKSYQERTDIQLLPFLLRETKKETEIARAIRRVRKLTEEQNIHYGDIYSNMKAHPGNALFVLRCFEMLDEDHRRNSLDALVQSFPDSMTAAQLAELNGLKPFQRAGLKNFHGFHSEISANRFLAGLRTVQTQAEMDYLVANGMVADLSLGKDDTARLRHTDLWKDVEQKTQAHPELALKDEGYKTVEMLLRRSIPHAAILKNLDHLSKITTDSQQLTVRVLFTRDNLDELLSAAASCQENCSELWEGPFREVYFIIINNRPPLGMIVPLAKKLVELQKNENIFGLMGVLRDVAEKNPDPQKFLDTVSILERPDVAEKVRALRDETHYAHLDPWSVKYLINRYFFFAVAPEDLRQPERVVAGLAAFLEKANREKYDAQLDQDFNKGMFLLDPQKIIEKAEADFPHIAFILNVVQDSQPQYTKEKLKTSSLNQLDAANPQLKEKGAKLLIGLGCDVHDFDQATVAKIAERGVDGKLTRYKISDNITAGQLAYLAKPENGSIPLSLYFSILMTLEERKSPDDQAAFETLIKKYKAVEHQPVYEGRLLTLTHNPADRNHSYLFASDPFNPEAHKTFAGDIQKLPVSILQHGVKQESVESMLTALEQTTGTATFLIGGHGKPGAISFGEEGFDMPRLFTSLAQRLSLTPEKESWNTTVIFESCYSSNNIETLMEMWKKDPRTKKHPVIMLASSSENEGSAKMAGDSWLLKARRAKESGTVLTWKELYHDIESRNFIMSHWFLNSNMTLYINGEKLG